MPLAVPAWSAQCRRVTSLDFPAHHSTQHIRWHCKHFLKLAARTGQSEVVAAKEREAEQKLWLRKEAQSGESTRPAGPCREPGSGPGRPSQEPLQGAGREEAQQGPALPDVNPSCSSKSSKGGGAGGLPLLCHRFLAPSRRRHSRLLTSSCASAMISVNTKSHSSSRSTIRERTTHYLATENQDAFSCRHQRCPNGEGCYRREEMPPTDIRAPPQHPPSRAAPQAAPSSPNSGLLRDPRFQFCHGFWNTYSGTPTFWWGACLPPSLHPCRPTPPVPCGHGSLPATSLGGGSRLRGCRGALGARGTLLSTPGVRGGSFSPGALGFPPPQPLPGTGRVKAPAPPAHPSGQGPTPGGGSARGSLRQGGCRRVALPPKTRMAGLGEARTCRIPLPSPRSFRDPGEAPPTPAPIG